MPEQSTDCLILIPNELLSSESISKITVGNEELYIIAKVEYQNVFEKNCFTKICYSTSEAKFGNKIREVYEKNSVTVNWELCSKYNEAD